MGYMYPRGISMGYMHPMEVTAVISMGCMYPMCRPKKGESRIFSSVGSSEGAKAPSDDPTEKKA